MPAALRPGLESVRTGRPPGLLQDHGVLPAAPFRDAGRGRARERRRTLEAALDRLQQRPQVWSSAGLAAALAAEDIHRSKKVKAAAPELAQPNIHLYHLPAPAPS